MKLLPQLVGAGPRCRLRELSTIEVTAAKIALAGAICWLDPEEGDDLTEPGGRTTLTRQESPDVFIVWVAPSEQVMTSPWRENFVLRGLEALPVTF